jgi:hypothetical protein
MMYDTLKFHVVEAWAKGLSGASVVEYVMARTGASLTDVQSVINRLTDEMMRD